MASNPSQYRNSTMDLQTGKNPANAEQLSCKLTIRAKSFSR